ncbi:hypothetical protein [Halopseudomonas salegens]|uniref:Uncharacterized protein n=1 Tax=Halopseudomonas salegens TaxID=1434072 RepID=A0A1H2FKV5_9GAMM|nr:hypothetical protein [Halopseudomonas salegens]SDU07994.1 hypothetical protein SAMN05216210_1636 [Halopseudomonas salegens]
MRKALTGITLAIALASGHVMADEATLTALQDANIVMTDQQADAIEAATGEELIALITELAEANVDQAAAIVSAAVKAADSSETATAIANSVANALPANARPAIMAAARSAAQSAGMQINTPAGDPGGPSVPSPTGPATPSSPAGGGSSSASPT